MHYWYSSIVARKCVIKLSNKFIYRIFIKNFDLFLSLLDIIDKKRQIFEKMRR